MSLICGDGGKERSMHALRGSGTCGQEPYAEKCLLEFSASGPIWADDVQVANRPLTCHRELKQHVALYSPCCRPTRVDGRYLEKRPILRITRSDG